MAHVLPVAHTPRPWTRLLVVALIVAFVILVMAIVMNSAWLLHGFQWDPEAAKTWLSPLCGGMSPPCG